MQEIPAHDHPEAAMSDTVLIALITFGSGFVGALFGFLTARMSAKEQRKREAEATLFQKRFNAYAEFLEALEQWAVSPTDLDAKAHLFRKVTEAALISSEETAHYLDLIQAYVLKFKADISESNRAEFLRNKSALLAAMRKDLSLLKKQKKTRSKPT